MRLLSDEMRMRGLLQVKGKSRLLFAVPSIYIYMCVYICQDHVLIVPILLHQFKHSIQNRVLLFAFFIVTLLTIHFFSIPTSAGPYFDFSSIFLSFQANKITF